MRRVESVESRSRTVFGGEASSTMRRGCAGSTAATAIAEIAGAAATDAFAASLTVRSCDGASKQLMVVQQSARSVVSTGCGSAFALCSQHGILAQNPITAVAGARLEMRSAMVSASALRVMKRNERSTIRARPGYPNHKDRCLRTPRSIRGRSRVARE